MIRRELGVFLVVGLLTVAVDLLCYQLLLWTGLAGVNLSKATSFLIGTLFAYFANRAWTFGHYEHAAGSFWRFSLLYATTLGANVLVNAGMLVLLAAYAWKIHAAFIIATGVSATLNFIGMRLLVFKPETAGKMP